MIESLSDQTQEKKLTMIVSSLTSDGMKSLVTTIALFDLALYSERG